MGEWGVVLREWRKWLRSFFSFWPSQTPTGFFATRLAFWLVRVGRTRLLASFFVPFFFFFQTSCVHSLDICTCACVRKTMMRSTRVFAGKQAFGFWCTLPHPGCGGNHPWNRLAYAGGGKDEL